MRNGISAMLVVAAAAQGCAMQQPGRERYVRLPPRCADETVAIYFEPQSADITREGRQVIYQAAVAARGCAVLHVEVTGLAEAAGPPGSNLELSRRRAVAVADALKANGLPAADFHVKSSGQVGAVAPDGGNAPLRRRADLTIRLGPLK
jgi:outer membrane protein OmpA-like peptidoglycan-associated protein